MVIRVLQVEDNHSRYKSGRPSGVRIDLNAVLVQGSHELEDGKEMDDCYP